MNEEQLIQSTPILNVSHVGGRGGLGPGQCLINLGKDSTFTLYEASIESFDEYKPLIEQKDGTVFTTIPMCISNFVGKGKFNVNDAESSNSVYKTDHEAKSWTHGCFGMFWGIMSNTNKELELDVTTIDNLYKNNTIKYPDVLSMDAQGSECDILEGSSHVLHVGDMVAVITEVEFSPIYKGQKLFTDQDLILREHRFEPAEFYGIEYWYPGPMIGKGHFKVAEVLFLRNYNFFIDKYNKSNNAKNNPIHLNNLLCALSKLAIVSHYLNRTSNTFVIMDYIYTNLLVEWEDFTKKYTSQSGNDKNYLHTLVQFYNLTKGSKDYKDWKVSYDKNLKYIK